MQKTSSEKKTTGIAAVERALNVLEVLYRENRPMGVNEIAALLGEYQSTTHRVVTTLKERGYLAQNADSAKYSLGYNVYMLGKSIEEDSTLIQLAKPYAMRIAEQTQETVNIGVRVLDGQTAENGYRAITLLQERAAGRKLRSTESLGRPYLCYYSGIGKALLAFSPDYDEALIRTFQFTKRTKRSISNPDDFIAEIHRIRELGYAIDNEENEYGLYCIACPVLDGKGNAVMAMSVSGFAGHMHELGDDKIVACLKDACCDISRRLL